MDDLAERLRQLHRRQYPNCTYGDTPHFVPPGGNTIGFYLCDVPDDLRNHTRCQPPYNHEHDDHNVW